MNSPGELSKVKLLWIYSPSMMPSPTPWAIIIGILSMAGNMLSKTDNIPRE